MWRKALRDTCSYFGWNRKTIIPLVAWVIGAIIYWKWQGWEAVREEIAIAVAFTSAPLLYFLLAYCFNLIRAPVYIKWEREKEPQLVVDGTSVTNYGDNLGHSWRLKITNKGTKEAENCRGQLVVLADEVPDARFSLERWPVNEYFEWAIGSRESISIPGLHTAELEIASHGGYGESLQLAYAKGAEFRKRHAVKIFCGSVLMILSISCKDKLPIYAICGLLQYTDNSENLKLIEVTTKKPDITHYQKSNPDKEGSQTE